MHNHIKRAGIKPKLTFKSLSGLVCAGLLVIGGIYVVGRSLASTALPADINNDGKVDVFDLSLLLGKWNTSDAAADIDHSGVVNVFDLSILLNSWGRTASPSPSATASATPTHTATPTPSPVASVPAGSGPCNRGNAAPAQYKHVIMITFENFGYNAYLTDSRIPYTRSIAAECGLATNYYGVTEPSLPNYIALASGDPQGLVGSDASPHNPGNLTADNIFNQVKQSGRQWRNYAESMPSNCYHSDSSDLLFTAHHQAAAYFADIAADCNNWMIPSGTATSGALATDIAADNLQAFTVISPNDDGGCSSCGGDVDPQKMDAYLKAWLTKIFAMPSYQRGETAVMITWDEDDTFEKGAASNGKDHIPQILIAPSIPAGTVSAAHFDHYSLLRTQEEMLGISNYLGAAASASSMRSAFHL